VRRLALALLALGGNGSLSVQAQAPDAQNIFHFSGPGKVCPQIVSLVEQRGGRVDWGANNLIAYDCTDDSNHFQTWVMNPDGSGAHCLSSQNQQLAQLDNGNPAWHPSGNYIVLEASDMPAVPMATTSPARFKRVTSPGMGFDNDLWLMSPDGTLASQLTHLAKRQGVLHPHFAHLSNLLLWSEMESATPQKWVMRLAKFAVGDNGPQLSDLQTLDPLGNAFYETHCFSPDDRSILFSTTKEPGDFEHMYIVRLELATGHTVTLTDPAQGQWNEHAQYSPDGSKIIWISSEGIPQNPTNPNNPANPNKIFVKTDYWMMNADGSNKHRLTYFNEPGAPEYRPSQNIASDLSWSPDGKSIVACLQMRRPGDKVDDFPGSILRITLP
jgi:Tol biopolymer transport system component